MVNTLETNVAALFGVLTPILSIADPAIGAAVGVVGKILVGVAAAEPTAIGLYNQISSGKTPTAAELMAYAANYESAYDKLMADIAAAGGPKVG